MNSINYLFSENEAVPVFEKPSGNFFEKIKTVFRGVFPFENGGNKESGKALQKAMEGMVRIRRKGEAEQKLREVGHPKNERSPNRSHVDLMARTVMRYPSQQAREILQELHKKLGEKLANQSEDALNWLLGGIVPGARGRFESVQILRRFLARDPKTIASSRLISGLNMILTALCYRSHGNPKSLPPIGPETVEQKSLFDTISAMFSYSVPDHSERYLDSRSSMIASKTYQDFLSFKGRAKQQEEVTAPFREEISDASGSDIDESCFKYRTKGGVFSPFFRGQVSWAGVAAQENVPIRAGISATALGVLTTIEWLFGEEPGKLSSHALELFVGTLLIPVMHRGDFHSIAEIAAAFDHYIKERSPDSSRTEVLSPRQALEKGLELMIRAMDQRYQGSAEVLCKASLENTRSIGYASFKKPSSFSSDQMDFLIAKILGTH